MKKKLLQHKILNLIALRHNRKNHKPNTYKKYTKSRILDRKNREKIRLGGVGELSTDYQYPRKTTNPQQLMIM